MNHEVGKTAAERFVARSSSNGATAAITKATTGVLPPAKVIGLHYLNVAERAVLAAIRTFSGGRFPDPERQLLKGRTRAVLTG